MKNSMRILGVDHGLKKIGLALGDSDTKISAPLDVILREGADQVVRDLVQKEGIDLVIVGDPTSRGPASQKEDLDNFIATLREFAEVVLIDESYTTSESQALQGAGDRAEEDAIAANLILEAYFSTV